MCFWHNDLKTIKVLYPIWCSSKIITLGDIQDDTILELVQDEKTEILIIKKNIYTVPRHLVSTPLQSPLTPHSLTCDPTSVYPVLHMKIAVAPNVVRVPILLP